MPKLLTYILRRLLIAIPTILIVSVFVFMLQKLLPGDPIALLLGEDRTPELIASLRAKYHLDDPIVVQYFAWLRAALGGDLGFSLRSQEPVLHLIGQKLPVTLELASFAMLIALTLGIPAGIFAAVKRGSVWDYLARAVALWGLSIPNFWLGILLILFISVELHWLPSSGYAPPNENLGLNLKVMIMPAFVLGNALAATIMRHTRSAMLGVLKADYIRTARANGLSSRAIILKHAFRNALVPVVTVAALLFGDLLAGAVLTEQIFAIPGVGKLIVDAVFDRDYAVVQGIVLCTALGFILMNLLADVAYFLLNPRLST